MRSVRIFCVSLLAILAAVSVSAQTLEADRAAIRAVIAQQIEAFRADDATTAFSFAAPGIQDHFGDPSTFVAMVKSGYGAIYTARAFSFGKIGGHHGVVLQEVDVTGADGAVVRAIYAMEKQPDGRWRIAGCQIVAPEGLET